MRLFVDTSAFVALEDRSDRRHGDARAFYSGLRAADRLWTSNYVVDETMTWMRYRLGHAPAVHFAESVLRGRLFRLVYVDETIEHAALRIFKKYKDKKLSFTDCTNAAIVESESLEGLFAFDSDFSALGLRVLPSSS